MACLERREKNEKKIVPTSSYVRRLHYAVIFINNLSNSTRAGGFWGRGGAGLPKRITFYRFDVFNAVSYGRFEEVGILFLLTRDAEIAIICIFWTIKRVHRLDSSGFDVGDCREKSTNASRTGKIRSID